MSDDDVPALIERGNSSSEYDDSSDEDSSSGGSSAEDSIPGLAPNNRRGNASNMNGNQNSYKHPPIPQARFEPNDVGSEGDSEDSDSDGPPPLENRGNDDSSSDDDSDSSGSMPNLINRKAESSDDSDSSEDDKRPKRRNGFKDSSDSSDDDDSSYGGMPGLQERQDSSSDDSSSEDETPVQRRQVARKKKTQPPPQTRKPKAKQQQPKPKIDPHEEFRKMVTNMMREKGFKGNADVYINDLKRELELQDQNKNIKGTYDKYVKLPNGREKLIAKMVKDITTKIQIEKEKAEERKRLAIQMENERKRVAVVKIASCYRRSRAQARYAKLRHGVILMQGVSRGVLARKLHFTGKVSHLEDFRRFYKSWRSCFEPAIRVNLEEGDWGALKEKQAFIRRQELLEDDELKETSKKLDDAMAEAMSSVIDDQDHNVEVETEEIDYCRGKTINLGNSAGLSQPLRKIHLSGDVVKWLRTGDAKYREFFERRMKQLASGDTSRILRKRLQGSTRTIYEVYLEQKSGFRILWTEKDDYVLIWYVAKHKNVSKLIKLIDDSRNRSERNRVFIDNVEGLDHINASITKNNRDRKEIVLDPLGNVPMKRYEVKFDDVEDISKKEWNPGLVLTEEEREVVETKGTVLLLGRSGTGKTICICNRMEFDRQMYKERPFFTQLFVARSYKLCKYVENTIGNRDGSKLTTFSDLRDNLENELPKHESIRDDFAYSSEKQIDFFRFKKQFFDHGTEEIDPLIVWTNIRSFIKGSMEALGNENGFMSEEQYMALGKKRCRFSDEQRTEIYKIFQKYQEFMNENELWDENDRIIALLRRLKFARATYPDLFLDTFNSWIQFDKIYVDEVQDYTQVECLLFFELGGAGNLFLAGDPAQNVARGVEFRFEDIRSVGYHVAGDDEGKKDLVPQKPKVVNINFRSHAGILQCAASVLGEMFHHFPDSAKMLGKDDGLFQGPRPGVFKSVEASVIRDLVQTKLNGVVVLTHDENIQEVKEKLGGYELVYGIRYSKGLEFKSVIIMDFFSTISDDLQTQWKEMLLHRADKVYHHSFALRYPEIEAQLKLLYTAVTRCIERLFFAETLPSKAGDAFVRWSTTTSVKPLGDVEERDRAIATLNDTANVDSMVMNRDEWLAAGISNAEAADAEENDLENASNLLNKAIYCFEKGRHDTFVRKAKLQLKSVELRLKIYRTDPNAIQQQREIEKEAVYTMRELCKADLSLEIAALGKALRETLDNLYPSSNFLQKFVIGKVGSS